MNKQKYDEMLALLKSINEWWRHGDAPISPHAICFNGCKSGKEDMPLRDQISEILSQKD